MVISMKSSCIRYVMMSVEYTYITYAAVDVELYICHVILQHSPPLVQPLVMMTFVLQDGWSPLYAASSKGHLDIVKTLIVSLYNMNTPTYCVCVNIASELIHAVVTRFTIMLLNT